MKNYALLLLAALALLSGCKDDTPVDPEPVLNGSDYYPIAPGDYAIFEVTESLQLGSVITRDSFQIRERVDSVAYTDLSGEPYFRVVRSIRNNAQASWTDDSVMVIKKTAQRVERQENNVRLIKLVFPMTENRSWNANLMNAGEPKNSEYVQVAVPYTLQRISGAENFPQTTLVQLTADSSTIHAKTLYERYAKNMGLIEKKLRDISYVTDSSVIGQYIINTATIRTEKLLERGNE